MVRKILFLLLVLIALLAIAYWQFRPDSLASVTTVSVSKGDVTRTLKLVGDVINDQTVSMTALLDGEITAIKAREGDSVRKGDTLAELDSREAVTLLDKAGAELQYQEQNLENATRNYTRLQNLSRAGNASKQALDDALNLKLSAEAAVKAAYATVSLAELKLQNARIESPFDGTVLLQRAEIGQWVEAGTALFTVVSDTGNVIEAEVDASEWSRVKLDQSAVLRSEAIPGKQWPSKVKWIAPNISEESGNTFAVRFSLDDNSPDFLLGQELDVDLQLDQVSDVTVAPLQALIEVSPDTYIAYIASNGEARKRDVTLGLKNLSDAEITSGLEAGDTLLIPGRHQLYDGMRISD